MYPCFLLERQFQDRSPPCSSPVDCAVFLKEKELFPEIFVQVEGETGFGGVAEVAQGIAVEVGEDFEN